MNLPLILLEVAGLLALAVVLGLLAKRVNLPQTVVLVVVGFVASAVGVIPTVGRLEGEAFEEVVVFGFLPALIFAAALGIDLRAFSRNLGSILALAVVAFSVSAVVVGLTLHAVLGTALVVAFLFGVLISATDPVAVVAIFREVGVPRRLLTIVEGESLFNDGVAIVLFAILLEAATGGSIDMAAGLIDFVSVFLGGAVIGAVVGLLAAAVLPWLARLPAVALSLSVAYGSFVLADAVLGFSGVVATAVAGMVLGGLAPSRGSAEVRVAWEETWEALDYVANALLFLLIGLVLGPASLGPQLGAILLAVAAVLVARAVGVVPVVWLLERVARIPRFGMRNEAVMVWGGLRGGVALALALALPEELAERDLLVALTGGVVLATLLLNATTIRWLVHRLGLDRPSSVDLFLSAVARLSGVGAARKRLHDLDLEDATEVTQALDQIERDAHEELERLDLDAGQQMRAVLGRALHIERTTYQRLSDEGLLPPTVTRTLLHEVDDEVDDLALRAASHQPGAGRRERTRLDQATRRIVGALPKPPGEDPEELAYAEAAARRLAARRTGEALELFDRLPVIERETVQAAREVFHRWEQEAIEELDELDERSGAARRELHERQALLLAEAAADRELSELTDSGLLPERLRHELPRLRDVAGRGGH
jgi:CPA1 family monovalent cation:H+ antiporter